MALGTPFEPVHLLFINLLTDSLPALAIGMEPIDKTLLKNKPRSPKEGILTKKFSISLNQEIFNKSFRIWTFNRYCNNGSLLHRKRSK